MVKLFLCRLGRKREEFVKGLKQFVEEKKVRLCAIFTSVNIL